jgi:hypothetical protein
MIYPLSVDILKAVFRIAKRLIDDSRPEGFGLLRELLASARSGDDYQTMLKIWSKLGSSPRPTLSEVALPLVDIASRLFDSGYNLAAARTLGTFTALTPYSTYTYDRALTVAREGFIHTGRKPSFNLHVVEDLQNAGMGLLQAGSSTGISLIGAAHSLNHKFSWEDLERSVENLPDIPPLSFPEADAKQIKKAVTALEFAGRKQSARRLQAIANYSAKMGSGPRSKFDFPRSIVGRLIDKGYASEVINLRGDVSAGDKIQIGIPDGGVGRLDSEIPFRVAVLTDLPQSIKEASDPADGSRKRRTRSFEAPSAYTPPRTPTTSRSSFYFRLEGAGAHCDQVIFGADFDFLFDYGVAQDVAARVQGKKLDPLTKGKHKLFVAVEPSGVTLRDDNAGKTATIEDGKISNPPRFLLKAPDHAPEERCGVSVIITYNRAPLYDFFVPLKLVEKLDQSPCAPLTLDLDLEDLTKATAKPRHATVFISRAGESWNVLWDIDGSRPAIRPTTAFTESKFKAFYSDLIDDDLKKVAEIKAWKTFDASLNLPTDSKEAALKSMYSAAGAGWAIYDALAADPVLAECLTLIDSLADGSSITVFSDGPVIPWELIYPIEFTPLDPGKNFDPAKFWGARFEFESLLFTKSDSEKQPSQRRQPEPLFVKMGFNESIDAGWNGRPIMPVDFQKDYCKKTLGSLGAYTQTSTELTQIFTSPLKASMIYLFCHGNPARLEFSKDLSVKPTDVSGDRYPNWPIVFMNTCEAGDIDPLSYLSFREKFRAKGAAGILAPAFPIPTLFAAVFGKALLDRYAKGEPIGHALRELRQGLLKNNIPLGLWYSLQCPLDITAPPQ